MSSMVFAKGFFRIPYSIRDGISIRWYLETNPDVRASGLNPLAHYIHFGHGEGRLPMPPDANG